VHTPSAQPARDEEKADPPEIRATDTTRGGGEDEIQMNRSSAEDVIPGDVGNEQPTEQTDEGTSNPAAEDSKDRTDMSVVRLIEKADHSAGRLVNLLVKHFPSFRDETRFEGKRVRFLKRAQILVADLWAAFNGTGYGELDDIDHLTMFAGGLHQYN
jgi:hypothetical protein